MVNPVLVVKGLKKEFYEGTSTLKIFDSVDFKLYPNEMVAIMGASGSGKTTLLNIITGLEQATDGDVLIEDNNIAEVSDEIASKIRRERLGLVFQDFNLLPHLTAEENVEIPLIFADIPEEERKRLALKAIQQTDMTEKANSYPNQLSGGEKQRIAISRAIVNKPSILLVDEPTGNLDSQTGKDIISLFRNIADQEGTYAILMTTHDPEAAQKADKIFLLQNGKLSTMDR
ncbi:MAG: ABC transporter ATP-binding protein [Candidatus Heimdallarchaeota archaeon]|nr:MAG: ABC transporter ATP-binding protein [Candidatus Heimdallarchaeota archaeon]